MGSAHRALQAAATALGFIARRNAPRTEPLDELDWANIDGAHEVLRLAQRMNPADLLIQNEETPPAPTVPEVLSAPAVVMGLRVILHQGGMQSYNDRLYVEAALRLLDHQIREGLL
jgi:hypothetical protein